MKKIFTSISIIAASLAAIGQSAITINASDMPIPSGQLTFVQLTQGYPSVPTGANQNWDYSPLGVALVNGFSYYPETLPFFTNAGVDVYRSTSKNLTPTLVYNTYSEYDFNANGVEEKGIEIPSQGYSLSSFTGGANDSMLFPPQQYIFDSPSRIFKFPFTFNSAWQSVSHRSTDFSLTVASAGIDHVPGKHVYDFHRQDTIIGWGKMKVNTGAGGTTIAYNVLLDKIHFYNVDSFYLGGIPAPTQLLTAFSVTQGQITGETFIYRFFRPGSFTYFTMLYFDDNTYSSPTEGYVNTNNLTLEPSGIEDLGTGQFATVLFPNPANGNEISLFLFGQNFGNLNYTITDLTGRTVQSLTGIQTTNNKLSLDLNPGLSNGIYFLKVTDALNNAVATEQFSIQR